MSAATASASTPCSRAGSRPSASGRSTRTARNGEAYRRRPFTKSSSRSFRSAATADPRSSRPPARSPGNRLSPERATRPRTIGVLELAGDGFLPPRLLGPAELLPDVADLVDEVDELLRFRDIRALLALRSLLRGLPHQLVQVR